MDKNYRVVIAGYRKPIREILDRKHIPYVIWSPKPVLNPGKALHQLHEDFTENKVTIEEIAQKLQQWGPFSHVIAGTEESVPAASLLRKALGARTFKQSVAVSCHDKLVMKNKLLKQDIPMTAYLSLKDKNLSKAAIVEKLGDSIVVKNRTQSGGSGIQFVKSTDDLSPFIGKDLIAEKFIDAPEASVETYIQNGEILFQNITQYEVNGKVNFVPSHFNEKTQQTLLDLNRKVIHGLDIQWGITHLEAYLTPKGPLFGEIALRPPGGYIMDLMSKAYEFDAWKSLVEIELGEKPPLPQSIQNYCGAWILHPGAGVVDKIDGWKGLKENKNIMKAKLKIKTGSKIEKRVSLGKDVGFIQFHGKTAKELESVYGNLKTDIQIQMKPKS